MTDNNDLFNSPALQGDPLKFDIDPNKNYLDEYVGENKKFKDVQALARAKAESDAHISRLEEEARIRNEDLAEIEKELKARTRLEEIRDQILNAKNNQSPSNQSTPDAGERDTNKSGLTKEDAESLALSVYEKAKIAETRNANKELVRGKLVEKFGSNYASALDIKTKELGLDKEEANRLSETAPVAFMKMLGLDAAEPTRLPNVSSSIKTNGFVGKREVQKTYNYYENIRKQDKALYNSPAIQKERRESMHQLGADFFD